LRDRLVPFVSFSLFLVSLIIGRAILRAPSCGPLAPKGYSMQFPTNTKPMVWGAVVGAAACMIIGFTWGGWVTGGTARKDSAAASHDAVVTALAPICAERFRAQGDSAAQIAALTKSSTWERGTAVEKSGFALMPGSKAADSDVARACAELLAAAVTPKT
jgi:hypothetical protein